MTLYCFPFLLHSKCMLFQERQRETDAGKGCRTKAIVWVCAISSCEKDK